MHLPLYVRLWFAADLMLALLPPVHWSVGGMPNILIYMFGSSVFIAASVIVAYLVDRRTRS